MARGGKSGRPAAVSRGWSGVLLVAVGVAYVVIELATVGTSFGLSADEAIYLSQVTPHVPAAPWHAWRSWGTPVLLSPVAVLSPSLADIRVYATLLSAVALVAAFWPWLGLLRGVTVPLAALLYGTTWVSIYFGNNVQPNAYVALAAVGAAGLYTRLRGDPRHRWPMGLAVTLGVLALLRPTDAVLVGGVLLVATLWQGGRSRRTAVLTVVAGVALGLVPWVIEAYARFGGPAHRYRQASAADAVGGLHLGAGTARLYLRMLDGQFYGYPATAHTLGPYPVLWCTIVAAAAMFATVGIVVASCRGEWAVGLASLAAVAFLLFYVGLLGYAALRFVLPAVALGSIALAYGLVVSAESLRASRRRVAAVVPVLAVGAFVGLNVVTAAHLADRDRPGRARYAEAAAALRTIGVPRPCLVLGTLDPMPTAYWARCAPGGYGLGASLVEQAREARADGRTVVVVSGAKRLPAYFDGWRRVRLTGVGDGHYNAWISPASGAPPP